MASVLEGFQPELLWKHFEEISKIPRCSGDEKAVGDYILSVAKDLGLEAEQDKVGNVVVRKPASAGKENAQTVILQGHVDMVCEKNSDVQHDFTKDGIELQVKDGWLMANGTTLGADNGVGVAAGLAVMEDTSLVHGPLEFLFTIDEETGLTGAAYIQPGFLQGKTYLNLDSEDEGVFCIGCAGGADSIITLPIKRQAAPDGDYFKVHVSGLRGGHSGIDIDQGRANALKVLARLLWEPDGNYDFSLAAFEGGNKRNAIAREAYAEIIVPTNNVDAFKERVTKLADDIKFEFKTIEKDMDVTLSTMEGNPGDVFDAASQQLLLNSLYVLPHGVLAMSQDIPGLVETSNNVATITCKDDGAVMQLSSRSSVKSALEAVRHKLKSFVELIGAQIEQPEGYPSWTPNVESPLLKILQGTHKEVFNKEAKVEAIHAGLECGIIGEKFPGMDMISFGPTIEHPHSPEERCNTATVETFWKLLTAALEKLS